MRKFLILCVSISAFCLNQSCQSLHDKQQDAILWEISGNNLSSPSYLLGTKHDISCRVLHTIPNYKHVVSKVTQVVLESDYTLKSIDIERIFENRAKAAKASKIDSDTTYKMLYSPEDYHFVATYLSEKRALNIDSITIKPIQVVDKSVKVSKRRLQRNDTLMDVYIHEFAKENNYKLVFLETLEDVQLSFDNFQSFWRKVKLEQPLKIQAKVLLDFIKNDSLQYYTELSDSLYKNQKIRDFFNAKIDHHTHYFPLKTVKEVEQIILKGDSIILDKRNEKWMTKIPTYIHNAPSLIAVGVNHLFGYNNIIQMLREKGYTVKPISMSQQ